MDFSGDNFFKWAETLDKSEDFIEGLKLYVDKLEQLELPVIFSLLHWAKLMGMEVSDLKNVLDNREEYYNHFRIPKKNGGYRYISAPSRELRTVQQWIKVNILDKIKHGGHLTSYQAGKSILDNAKQHVGHELIVKFDLKNFFESITQDRVYGIFKFLGYNSSLSIELARACCIDVPQRIGRKYTRNSYACLPQGSAASPGLSNIAAAMLDLRLIRYANKRNLNYTRYADDITFSGNLRDKPVLITVKNIVESEKFCLNIRKTWYVPSSGKQLVTGLNVNTRPSIPKAKRREIHTHLHNCIKVGPFENLRRLGYFKLNYREWLLGNIVYIQMVHPEEGKKMRQKFEKINWL